MTSEKESESFWTKVTRTKSSARKAGSQPKPVANIIWSTKPKADSKAGIEELSQKAAIKHGYSHIDIRYERASGTMEAAYGNADLIN